VSIFASHKQDTVPVPFDRPHTVTVRKLTGRELELAQESHAQGVALGRSRVWASTFRLTLEKGFAASADVIKALNDPLTGYDRYSLVASGLVAWTYPQSVARPAKDLDAEATKAALRGRQQVIDDLDDEAVEFIAREVLRLTKPSLFQNEEEAKADQKEIQAAASIA
jgi:hypothetical protein